MVDYREKTDEFFYDNFSRAWEGTTIEKMLPIYISEISSLIYYLEKGESYIQEFAKDYTLEYQLSIEVDGKLQHIKKPKSPYTIIPSPNIVLFQKNGETVYQCSYRKYFQILDFYIKHLRELFPVRKNGEIWEEKLEKLQKERFKKYIEKITDKLRFWDNSAGNPNSSYEGAKRIDLKPGDIASFKQLNCKDTLRYLTVNGLVKAKDLEVLSEYTELKTLYLRQMDIKDISFISHLTNLDELGLQGNKITDLSPLASLKKLTHLYIADNPVTDFSVVEEMPKLRTLYTDIDQLPDQIAWDKIPSQISLRVLSLTPLENCLYHAETIYSRQVSNLVEKSGGKQNLAKQTDSTTKLNIKDRWLYSGLINSLGYQPSIKYDLTKVKSLDCSNNITLCDSFMFLNEIGDYSCLSLAINLKDLNLSGRVINDFSWLSKCVNIKNLDLSNTDFSDISLVSEMKQLTSLNLSGCKKLTEESFEILKNMKKLKELNLSDTAFCNIELLKDMNRLNRLYLDKCENLSGIENMLYFLVNLDKYSFSEKELQYLNNIIIEKFCNIAKEKGYKIRVGGTGHLPVELSNIHHHIFGLWETFLIKIDFCTSNDENIWFLIQSAYNLHQEIKYPWEDIIEFDSKYEEIQNDYYIDEEDEEYEQMQIDIWKTYIPIMASLKNDVVTYYAISIYDNKIVFWNDNDISSAKSTGKNIAQFLFNID